MSSPHEHHTGQDNPMNSGQESERSGSGVARGERYAEALLAEVRSEPTMPGYERLARAVLVVADAEQAELRAEVDRLRRGGAELGRILDRTLRDALEASGRHDAIDDDGDGDWAVVWETLAELRPRAEAAEAEVARLRQMDEEQWAVVAMRNSAVKRAEAAEASRDAAVARERELRERVEALADEWEGEVQRLFHAENAPREAGRVMGCLTALRALAAAPAEPPAEQGETWCICGHLYEHHEKGHGCIRSDPGAGWYCECKGPYAARLAGEGP